MDLPFKNIYSQTHFPIVVCRKDGLVEYANSEAFLHFIPSYSVEMLIDCTGKQLHIYDFLSAYGRTEIDEAFKALKAGGFVAKYTLKTNSGAYVKFNANSVAFNGSKYYVFYFFEIADSITADTVSENLNQILTNLSYSSDSDAALQTILNTAGSTVKVSRAYIFEDIDDDYSGNTYEWCAEGIEPQIEFLQKLPKADYNYDALIKFMYIADDVSKLPENDRVILEAQGIKAVAIVPIYGKKKPLGYIGFDDCVSPRKWEQDVLIFLQNISGICSSLIVKRNQEREIQRNKEIMQTISDSIDSLIYVSDPDTYEIKFVNKGIKDALGLCEKEIVSKKCWQALQKDMTGPCPFCPIEKLRDEDGKLTEKTYEWEHKNSITGNWYWIKDSVIKWIDGKTMHLEIAVDITMRKKVEEQLKYYASVDAMTNTFNRDGGYQMLNRIMSEIKFSGENYSLCFLDIDGLKRVNDTFGHSNGDIMIKTIVSYIKKRVRKDDVVCRWGGDEFVVIFGCGEEKAEEIMSAIKADLLANGQHESFAISFSYGVIGLTSDMSIDDAIKTADDKMYRDKMPIR